MTINKIQELPWVKDGARRDMLAIELPTRGPIPVFVELHRMTYESICAIARELGEDEREHLEKLLIESRYPDMCLGEAEYVPAHLAEPRAELHLYNASPLQPDGEPRRA